MINHLLNGLSAIGNVIDLPGSSVRDALVGKNPFDQYLTPLHDTNRTTGRDVARHYGLAGKEDTWGNFAGGLGVEIATDPLNLLGTGIVRNAFKAKAAVPAANAAIRAQNAKSVAQRAAGFMPEEVAKVTKIAKSPGVPSLQYHGTPHGFDTYDAEKLDPLALYGKGIYTTADPTVASSYTEKGIRSLPEGAATPHVKMHYVDARNPFDMDAMHKMPPVLVRRKIKNLRSEIGEIRGDYSSMKSDFERIGNQPGINREARVRELEDSLKHRKQEYFDAFRNRHSMQGTGDELYRAIADLEGNSGAQEYIRGLGHDAITHTGGSIWGGVPHKVTIAFDPSQMYAPYIAPAIRPELRVPRVSPYVGGAVGYNALARMRAISGGNNNQR